MWMLDGGKMFWGGGGESSSKVCTCGLRARIGCVLKGRICQRGLNHRISS